MMAMLWKWDEAAKEQGEPEKRKMIWRIMDALEGKPLAPEAAVWLDFVDQNSGIRAIREELGIDDVPMWARRAG